MTNLLGEAAATVDERMQAYGPPGRNHAATAAMWATYLQRRYGVVVPVDGYDVCWLNILQKASRDANDRGRDNLLDTAGYALNADMVAGAEG